MTQRSPKSQAPAHPPLAIALGGGGARGLAHIAALEAFDELGLKPTAIAGTSMGAVIGAAYASGLSARELRDHVLAATANRRAAMGKLMKARVGRWSDLVRKGLANPVLLDAEICLDLFWPSGVCDHFEQLEIPLQIVATDFYGRSERVFSSGSLTSAVAGSMAMPGLIRPVDYGGRVLVDGGAVNALPYDLLFETAGIVIAIDVTFGGRSKLKRSPSPFEAMFGSAQIMQEAVTNQKLRARMPDILIKPAVSGFTVLDFFKAKEIFSAAAPAKEELKRRIGAVMAIRA